MFKKSQHIAEYMVVFEVFIVATVIVITALGLIPEISSGSMFRSSDQLLSIGPIGLLEHSFDECGGYQFKFRNNKNYPITLQGVFIGNEKIFRSSLTFLPGLTYYIEGSIGFRNEVSKLYEYPITVSYTNEEIGGIVNESYNDPLYGHYLPFFKIGDKTYLNQKILSDYCFVDDNIKNHVNGASNLDLYDVTFIDMAKYKAIKFNGKNSYADAGQIFTKKLKSFTIESLLKLNYTKEKKGIFYKPNSFYLTVKGNKLYFGVFKDGSPIEVSSSFNENKWMVIHLEFDKEIKIYINGVLKQNLPLSFMDGSLYNTYFGTYTPNTNKNSLMSLGTFTFFNTALSNSEINERANHIFRMSLQ